ncbi:right-handed parallel beta-helix repeat-containing protein [Candidatus Micrarchaeota archaeon]|nr:right-handed parallel beta-helix repeat-containing protein [Candidatus Micrarchaeota archaeon]
MLVNKSVVFCPGEYNLSGSIIINADDIVVLCNNTVLNRRQGLFDYIKGIENKGHKNVTVSGCTLKNFWYGIYWYNGTNGLIEDNTIIHSDRGVLIEKGFGNKIINNSAAFSTVGIEVIKSYRNTIFNNRLQENRHDLYLAPDRYSGWDVEICSNLIKNNTGSNDLPIGYYNYSVNLSNKRFSLLILCDADYSNLNNITVEGSTLQTNNGMYLLFTDNSKIANSRSYGNNYGFFIDSGSNNTIINSTATYNDFGIYLFEGYNNIFINNIISSNKESGMLIVGSYNTTILNNTITDNRKHGVWMDRSNAFFIIDNIINDNNVTGIFIERFNTSSKKSSIVNNYIQENHVEDIYLSLSDEETCHNIMIKDNLGSMNLPIGYYDHRVNISHKTFSELILCNADYSNINNVTVRGSSSWNNNGLILLFTDYSNVSNSKSNNNYEGFTIKGSYNTIINNTANYNQYHGILIIGSSNTLMNNTANYNKYGIKVHKGSSDNSLINNICCHNQRSDIALYTVSNLTDNFCDNLLVKGVKSACSKDCSMVQKPFDVLSTLKSLIRSLLIHLD